VRLPFRDRREAGAALVPLLAAYRDDPSVVVFGLPRGGVPVAAEVARGLGARLDVFLVRKLGVPGHEELAFGAVANGRVRVLNDDVIRMAGLAGDVIERVTEREYREIERREQLYRGGQPPLDARGRAGILVDDGLATGATMLAAARSLRAMGPARLIVAVPVGSAEACDVFRSEVDEVHCAATPEPFRAVGLWYDDFNPTTDDEVIALLERGRGSSQ
jgi:putative phosphoribosyl transferase